MPKDKLKPVKGVAGLFVNSSGRFVIRTTAMSEKTGKLAEKVKTLADGTTREQAIRELANLKERLRLGGPEQPQSQAPTVEVYAQLWAKRRLSRGNWNADGGTADTVGGRLDRYVVPELGDYLVDRITYADLQLWLDRMGARGLGARTIRASYTHLRSLIREARQDYGFPPLPAFPDPPRDSHHDRAELTWENYDADPGALTQGQLGSFLAAARERSPRGWYPFCLLGFASGARFSELAAVEVHDLDFSDEIGVWLCRRHLVQSRGEVAPGIKWSKRGNIKTIDAESTRLLRPFLVGKPSDALVFPSDVSGHTYRSMNGLRHFLDAIEEVSGLPRMTSKTFRQTFITMSHLDARASAMAQAQAGHADANTTAMYIKPSVEAQKQHAKRMGVVLYPVPDLEAEQ